MRLAAAAVALAACTPADDTVAPPAPLDDRAGMPPDRYIYVPVRDDRDCDPPACGGWWVQRVDAPELEYVANIDLVGTGLDDEAQLELITVASANPDIARAPVAFRGMLVPSAHDPDLKDLRVTTAWRGPVPPDGYRHDGTWYSFTDDYPEAVCREVGGSEEYAARVEPAAPGGVRDRDTLVVGWRAGSLLAVDYRLIKVRP